MKRFEKMTGREFCVFFLMSVLAGVTIGIGGTSSLLAANVLGAWGKLVGACLFSLGIYAIVVFEMRLFTGMVADIPTMGLKNMWRLAVVFIGNTLGVLIVAALVSCSPLSVNVMPQAAFIGGKLTAEGWAYKVLCSSVLCGFLISISVLSVKYAPKKGVSATVGVILPIIVFAFCGFDHSVANMLYLYFYGEISLQIAGYVLLSIVGNMVGGVALPLVLLLREVASKK